MVWLPDRIDFVTKLCISGRPFFFFPTNNWEPSDAPPSILLDNSSWSFIDHESSRLEPWIFCDSPWQPLNGLGTLWAYHVWRKGRYRQTGSHSSSTAPFFDGNNNNILRFTRCANLNKIIKMLRTKLYTLNCVELTILGTVGAVELTVFGGRG